MNTYTIERNAKYNSAEVTFKGKTYREKQNDLREKAIRFQSDIFSAEGLYMGEYAEIVNWFSKNARRYGLWQEFTENAII